MRFNITSKTYGDITIRSKSITGNDVELDKINQKFGDYLLYCWGTAETINEFIIVDLEEFRENQDKFLVVKDRWNLDGLTALNGYDLQRIIRTPCCVVANLIF